MEDLRFHSDELDIPMLDIHMQPESGMDLPLLAWGRVGRGSLNQGTWHCYVDDYKFEGLWKRPDQLLKTKCKAIVEPNFSTCPQSPIGLTLWNTYRKRWLARYWQSKGIRVWVDLNVSEEVSRLNLLGVPQGWRAYVTRGSAETLEQVDWDYYLAKERCGGDPLFVVYSGGAKVEKHCRDRGYIYFRDSNRERVDHLAELRRVAKPELSTKQALLPGYAEIE